MNNPHNNPACKVCLWWEQSEKFPTDGLCRRHAPRATLHDEENYLVGWPQTSEDEFCGEHQPVNTTLEEDKRLDYLTPKLVQYGKIELTEGVKITSGVRDNLNVSVQVTG